MGWAVTLTTDAMSQVAVMMSAQATGKASVDQANALKICSFEVQQLTTWQHATPSTSW